jgi:matrixin
MRILVVVSGLLLLLPASAHSFICGKMNGNPNGPCLHWAQGETTLQALLGSSPEQLLNGTLTWDQNAVNAANDWNAVGAAFHFTTTVGGQADACACPGSSNPVMFSAVACGEGFGDIVGETLNCYNVQTGALVNSSVFLNSANSWNAYDGPLRPPLNDARRVLLHEFGHVLGLAHPDDSGQSVVAIMNSHESNLFRLQSDDIAGIFSLYPNGGGGGGGGSAANNGCVIAAQHHDRSWPFWATVAAAAFVAARRRQR